MIRLKKVSAGYHDKKVIKKINLNIEPGKITVLVGNNGCGKSTLLKSMIHLIESEGEIIIDNIPIKDLKPNELAKHIAYLPQNRKVPELQVLKLVLHGRFPYLNYPRIYQKEDVEIAKKAIRWVGLENYENELVSKLSGGMQQIAYIAMTLAQDTNTILLDEPTSFLDIQHQFQLMKIAKQLANKQKAVVMVLHDLASSLEVADQLVVMDHGEILSIGTPQQIIDQKILQDLFDIEIHKVQISDKYHYLCKSKECE